MFKLLTCDEIEKLDRESQYDSNSNSPRHAKFGEHRLRNLLARNTPEIEWHSRPEESSSSFTSPEQDGLNRLATEYARCIEEDMPPGDAELLSDYSNQLTNLAYTLADRRTIFDWRAMLLPIR